MILSCLCLVNSSSSFSSQRKPHFLGWHFLGPRLGLFPCISSSSRFTHYCNSLFKVFLRSGWGHICPFRSLVYGPLTIYWMNKWTTASSLRLKWTRVLFGERTCGVICLVSSILLGNHFPFFQSISPCLLLSLETVVRPWGDKGQKDHSV